MRRLINNIMVFFLQQKGVKVSNKSYIHHSCQIINSKLHHRQGVVQIASRCELQKGVCINAFGGQVIIEENTFLGQYTVIYGHGNVHIGKNCLISMHCRIISSNHTIPSRDKLIRDMPDILLPVSLGDDVWIGAGVTILGGVKIGKGSVVGAGAVVTKDIPEYSIAVGNPAKVLKYRP